MPDSFEHMPEPVVRMPNGALTSLAGNVDPPHAVAVADLILVQRRVRQTVEQLVGDFQPDLVGLSVMTFQRTTARKIARLIHALRPSARIVVGGYDPSLAPEAYEACGDIEFIVHGEGEQTLCELLRAIDTAGDCRAPLHKRVDMMPKASLRSPINYRGRLLKSLVCVALLAMYSIGSSSRR